MTSTCPSWSRTAAAPISPVYRNPTSAVAVSTEFASCGRAVVATPLRGRATATERRIDFAGTSARATRGPSRGCRCCRSCSCRWGSTRARGRACETSPSRVFGTSARPRGASRGRGDAERRRETPRDAATPLRRRCGYDVEGPSRRRGSRVAAAAMTWMVRRCDPTDAPRRREPVFRQTICMLRRWLGPVWKRCPTATSRGASWTR